MFIQYKQNVHILTTILVLCLFFTGVWGQAQEYTIKRKKDKAGVVNAKGKEVIPFRYQEIYPSGTEGFYIVELLGKYGIIDNQDQPRTALKFDTIVPAVGQQKLFILKMGQKYTFSNLNERRLLPRVYDYIEEYPDAEYFLVKQEDKMGIVNFKDEEIVPIEYQEIKLYTSSALLRVKYGDKYGLLDMNRQKVLLPFTYDQINTPYPESSLALVKTEQKYGLVDVHNGKWVIPAEYDKISKLSFYSDIFIVEQNKKQGVYRQDGESLFPIQYEDIEVTAIKDERYYYLTENGKKGLYNQTGQPVIPVQYDQLTRYKGTDLFIVRRNNKMGILNLEGKPVLPIEYDQVEYLGDSSQLVKIEQNKKYGMADLSIYPSRVKFYKNLSEAEQQYAVLTGKNKTESEPITIASVTPSESVTETPEPAEPITIASVTPSESVTETPEPAEPITIASVTPSESVTETPEPTEPIIIASVTPSESLPIYNQVDQEALYLGGVEALHRFIDKNLEGVQNPNKGEVLVRLVVETNGKISDVYVLDDEAGSSAEVLRVLKQTENWIPAQVKGQAVRSYSLYRYEFKAFPPQQIARTEEQPKQEESERVVYNQVDKEALYPGGMEGVQKFIAQNLQTVQSKASGEVLVRFVVETDGRVSETTVLSDETGNGEAVAVTLKQAKAWQPAQVKGKAVASYSILLYEFK